jgi:hypothetical protein
VNVHGSFIHSLMEALGHFQKPFKCLCMGSLCEHIHPFLLGKCLKRRVARLNGKCFFNFINNCQNGCLFIVVGGAVRQGFELRASYLQSRLSTA